MSDSLPPSRRHTASQLADYLLELGAALAGCGCPSYRVEDAIRRVAEIEGYGAEAFALPTGLFLRVMTPGDSPDVLRMERVRGWGVDLADLVAVDDIFNDVAARRITIERARALIRALPGRPPTYKPVVTFLVGTVVSGAAAIFFGGVLVDVVASLLVALVLSVLSIWLGRAPSRRLLLDFAAGVLAATGAGVALAVRRDVHPEIIVLAVTISYFPGMTFTTGLAELAQKNLVSGAARLMEAFITLLHLVLGVALVIGVRHAAQAVVPEARAAASEGLSLAWHVAALFIASIGFGVVLSVPRRFLWSSLASGAVAYVATAYVGRNLPSHVGAFVGAFLVCVLANAFARATQRPAQLFQMPGMLLLVPGSFGFVSLGAFLRGDYVGGASKAFAMMLVGGALVLGVLMANVILPPRKIL